MERMASEGLLQAQEATDPDASHRDCYGATAAKPGADSFQDHAVGSLDDILEGERVFTNMVEARVLYLFPCRHVRKMHMCQATPRALCCAAASLARKIRLGVVSSACRALAEIALDVEGGDQLRAARSITRAPSLCSLRSTASGGLLRSQTRPTRASA